MIKGPHFGISFHLLTTLTLVLRAIARGHLAFTQHLSQIFLNNLVFQAGRRFLAGRQSLPCQTLGAVFDYSTKGVREVATN